MDYHRSGPKNNNAVNRSGFLAGWSELSNQSCLLDELLRD